SWQEHRSQNGDNGDDDQQLNQREGCPARPPPFATLDYSHARSKRTSSSQTVAAGGLITPSLLNVDTVEASASSNGIADQLDSAIARNRAAQRQPVQVSHIGLMLDLIVESVGCRE